MKDLRHQHICQLYEVIETPEYYFLVLEVLFEILFMSMISNKNKFFYTKYYSIFVMVNYSIIL